MKVAPDREVTIYALKREGEPAPYYIGQAVNPTHRRRQHGVKPSEMIVIERVPALRASEVEKEWIHRALALGLSLRNDHHNHAKVRTYQTTKSVTFGPRRSGTIYCWLTIRRGPEIIEEYSLRRDTDPSDPLTVWRAVADMGQWLRDLGHPDVSTRPEEWAQGRAERGGFPFPP